MVVPASPRRPLKSPQQPLKSPGFKFKTTPSDPKAQKAIKDLKDVYERHILPLEKKYKFDQFGYFFISIYIYIYV
jgi:hypothetical protein